MKYCKTCNLSYGTPISHCLFCNSTLEESQDTSELSYKYPEFRKQKKSKKLFKKILSFLIIIGLFTCLFLDIFTTKSLSWSLYTNSSLLYVLYVGFKFAGKQKTIRKLTSVAYASVVFLLVLGLFGKSSVWAIDFILPLCLFAINICLTFYFLFCKPKAIHDVAIYNLSTSLLSIIPLILLFCHRLSYAWPSLTCGLFGIIIIFGLLFFSTKQTKDEIIRRFHL